MNKLLYLPTILNRLEKNKINPATERAISIIIFAVIEIYIQEIVHAKHNGIIVNHIYEISCYN